MVNKQRGRTKNGLMLQRILSRLFAQRSVEIGIGVLIVISVVLTLVEFAFDESPFGKPNPPSIETVIWLNNGLTLLFVVELTLRLIASRSKRRFFREFWIDIVAVVPHFRIFRAARVARLLRLMRVLRMFGVVGRLRMHFPAVLRRGLAEYLVVCGLLLVTVVFGTGAMMFFERDKAAASAPAKEENGDRESFDVEHSFWFSLYSLFAGEPIPGPPRTLGGKIVAVFVMFMGLSIFAMFTGTVSAFMVERFRTEGNAVDWDQLRDHIVVCGWNSKAEIIVQEYRASTAGKETPIVAVAQLEQDPPNLPANLQGQVLFLNDDFTRVAALEKAGIHRAQTCIILSDTSGGRSEQDADARTILAALTVEKLNPSVYTCAELINRSYATHLNMGQVNDYVVSGEFSAYMLVQAAMNRGLMGVLEELLTYEHGNEFYRMPLPDDWLGKSYLELFDWLKRTHNATLVAIHPSGKQMMVNPADHRFVAGDEIVVIAEDEFEFDDATP